MDSECWPPLNKTITYEKGENRKKHLGKLAVATMVQEKGNNWVGKCPKGFSLEVAQKILERAFPEYRNTTDERPYRLWAYYDGAVYAIRSQDGGMTWHGYPNGYPMNAPPRGILKLLEQSAKDVGEEDKLKAWLNKR